MAHEAFKADYDALIERLTNDPLKVKELLQNELVKYLPSGDSALLFDVDSKRQPFAEMGPTQRNLLLAQLAKGPSSRGKWLSYEEAVEKAKKAYVSERVKLGRKSDDDTAGHSSFSLGGVFIIGGMVLWGIGAIVFFTTSAVTVPLVGVLAALGLIFNGIGVISTILHDRKVSEFFSSAWEEGFQEQQPLADLSSSVGVEERPTEVPYQNSVWQRAQSCIRASNSTDNFEQETARRSPVPDVPQDNLYL